MKMKKSIKLPVFLGAVALISTAALAIVNGFTEPVIEQNIRAKANEGYLTMFGLDNFDNYELSNLEISDELSNAGVTNILQLKEGDSIFGAAYDITSNGYGGELSFQVAFSGSKYAGFNIVSSKETPGFGSDILDEFTTYLKGKDISTTMAQIRADVEAVKAGSTITLDAVMGPLESVVSAYKTLSGR